MRDEKDSAVRIEIAEKLEKLYDEAQGYGIEKQNLAEKLFNMQ